MIRLELLKISDLTIPFRGISTNLLTFVLQSTGIWSIPTETIPSHNQSSKGNGTSLTPYLPRWVFKIIEVAGPNVGDIYTGRKTRGHK